MAQVTIHHPDGSTVIVEEEVEAYVEAITFKPIEPAPFWDAAYHLLRLKDIDVLDPIVDEDSRYLVESSLNRRKTYQRDDPLVSQLASLQGIPDEQMDTLWLYVQAYYV